MLISLLVKAECRPPKIKEDNSMTKDKAQTSELGGKGGTGFETGKENIFVCPECDAEHAFPGHKKGEPLMCPKCAIPLKSKYTK
jgi:hypothetical protein